MENKKVTNNETKGSSIGSESQIHYATLEDLASQGNESGCAYRDFSHVTAEEVYLVHGKQSGPYADTKLPPKLYAMLTDPDSADIITWLPHGRSFMIQNRRRFANEVLLKYYQHTNLDSFLRLVNAWGFHRVSTGPDKGSYYHELFLRNMPHLHAKMKRLLVHERKTLLEPEGGCPDFYNMPLSNQKNIARRLSSIEDSTAALTNTTDSTSGPDVESGDTDAASKEGVKMNASCHSKKKRKSRDEMEENISELMNPPPNVGAMLPQDKSSTAHKATNQSNVSMESVAVRKIQKDAKSMNKNVMSQLQRMDTSKLIDFVLETSRNILGQCRSAPSTQNVNGTQPLNATNNPPYPLSKTRDRQSTTTNESSTQFRSSATIVSLQSMPALQNLIPLQNVCANNSSRVQPSVNLVLSTTLNLLSMPVSMNTNFNNSQPFRTGSTAIEAPSSQRSIPMIDLITNRLLSSPSIAATEMSYQWGPQIEETFQLLMRARGHYISQTNRMPP